MVAALLNFVNLAQLTAMGRARWRTRRCRQMWPLPGSCSPCLAAIMLLYRDARWLSCRGGVDGCDPGAASSPWASLCCWRSFFVEYGSLEVTTRKTGRIAPAKVLPPKDCEARSWLSYDCFARCGCRVVSTGHPAHLRGSFGEGAAPQHGRDGLHTAHSPRSSPCSPVSRPPRISRANSMA